MIKTLFSLLFVMCCCCQMMAGGVTYTKADSVKVVKLLKEGIKHYNVSKSKANARPLMLYYGHKLKGVPYVGSTLEVNKTEQLVVNLRQLDCTTLVETCLALTLTTKQGSVKWADYLRNLQRIRYEKGVMDGYASRNHYFVWWMESNTSQGIITQPIHDDARRLAASKGSLPSFIARQTIDISWMTDHPDSYAMMKGKKDIINKVGQHERATKGTVMYYIPQASLGLSKKDMKYVEDGDILAIATKKKGLDTVHIGIAEWGSDGKLHLLNASQVHKKVVLESMTLKDYMSKHPVQIGIWVARVL